MSARSAKGSGGKPTNHRADRREIKAGLKLLTGGEPPAVNARRGTAVLARSFLGYGPNETDSM